MYGVKKRREKTGFMDLENGFIRSMIAVTAVVSSLRMHSLDKPFWFKDVCLPYKLLL